MINTPPDNKQPTDGSKYKNKSKSKLFSYESNSSVATDLCGLTINLYRREHFGTPPIH